MGVEPQRLRVRSQEALGERGARQEIKLLVLHRAQVLRPDLGLRLDLGDVDLLAHARFAQRVADCLGHRGVLWLLREGTGHGAQGTATSGLRPVPCPLCAAPYSLGAPTGSSSASSTRCRSPSVISTCLAFEPS